MSATEGQDVLFLTTDIVAAYVASNTVNPEELPVLIGEVYAALSRLGAPSPAPAPAVAAEPAVPVRKSLTDEYIVCLEDGRHFKSLKRHLRSDHNLTPAEYRAKWDLRADYPMVAPAYAEARSNLAKLIGLGQRGDRNTRSGRGGNPDGAEPETKSRKQRAKAR